MKKDRSNDDCIASAFFEKKDEKITLMYRRRYRLLLLLLQLRRTRERTVRVKQQRREKFGRLVMATERKKSACIQQ